jgi:hypothetical protein
MLTEEAFRRTGIRWGLETSTKNLDCQIVIGRREQIAPLLSPSLKRLWAASAPSGGTSKPEGFTVALLADPGLTTPVPASPPTLIIAGNDSRGLLFGAGFLLRKTSFAPGRAEVPSDLKVTTSPQYPVRGHQIGYRFKNNTYDAWTIAMFEQHIRDLAIFGNNTIQVIAPDSDDKPASPLYPAPALETLIGICQATKAYGLDFAVYYPEMAKDYSMPAAVETEVKRAEALFRAMPAIDAFYVPGGDPGHTEPKYLLPLVEKEAAVLHKYHPKAKVWISAQGFNSAWYREFYSILNRDRPGWITGFFVGPQSRDSFRTQRARIPARYQLQAYPDIAHTMHSQLPVPNWDAAYALSEGREPINPRPVAETEIYRHFAALHTGFVTYSEGVNDDVNKFVWDQLGWSNAADPLQTLGDYSRFFIGSSVGSQNEDAFAQGILALERNWSGPLLVNSGVEVTLSQFQQMEREASAGQLQNWRFQSALYRAYFDAYVRIRLLAETTQEQRACESLRSAPVTGSSAAIRFAEQALAAPSSSPGADLRARIFALAGELFHSIGLQLSVARYGASGVERGANLDRVDVALNDRAWMTEQFAEAARLTTEPARLAALAAVLNYSNPQPGGFYDDLGDPSHEPHLVLGHGWEGDPQLYETAINGIADLIPDDGLRVSWITYAETLYDTPVEMVYRGLDSKTRYSVRITYAGEGYTLPIRLVANDRFEIHALLRRDTNPKIVTYEIPAQATAGSTLDLKWTRPAGIGGGGRGLQIAEVWLIPGAVGKREKETESQPTRVSNRR